MDLAFAQKVIHDLADVVDRGVAGERDEAGFRIDLDLADVAAVGIIRRLGGERARRFEADVELRRQHRRAIERLRHVGELHGAVGADDAERAILELDVA